MKNEGTRNTRRDKRASFPTKRRTKTFRRKHQKEGIRDSLVVWDTGIEAKMS